MTIDYKAIQLEVADAIKQTGSKLVLYRLDTKLATTVGTVVEKKQSDVGQTTTSGLEILIPGNIKTAPLPGDDITIDSTSYHITSVKVVKPGPTVVLYKASVV